jgi:hypothetical protein
MSRKVVEVTVADGASNGFEYVELNGLIHAFKYDIAQCSGSTTVTFDLKDEDDSDWHTKASIAENAKTVEKLSGDNRVPVAGRYKIDLTQTNPQSGADSVHNVIILYKK